MKFINRRFLYDFPHFAILFVCILAFNCSKSFAMREVAKSTLEVAKRADQVVVAECTSSKSKWGEHEKLIFTYSTFLIQESVTGGEPEKEITLRIIGGQVDDLILSAPDMPGFREGEEVILFLGPKNREGYPTLASVQNGVLRIETDRVTGKKYITTPVSGIDLYKENTTKVISPSFQNGLLLEDFIYSIKKSLSLNNK